jgi:hypothetical protein
MDRAMTTGDRPDQESHGLAGLRCSQSNGLMRRRDLVGRIGTNAMRKVQALKEICSGNPLIGSFQSA